MSSMFLPSVAKALTVDQASAPVAEAVSSSGEERTLARADFSGLLALFASAQEKTDGAAETPTVGIDSWSMGTEAEEGGQEPSSTRAESEEPVAASGTPGSSTRVGSPPKAGPGETTTVTVGVDARSKPIPVAWARDLGVPMHTRREVRAPMPLAGVPDSTQVIDDEPSTRGTGAAVPASPEVAVAGIPVDGLRAADVGSSVPRTEGVDPAPHQAPQQGASQATPAVPDVVPAAQFTGASASAAPVDSVFAAQAPVIDGETKARGAATPTSPRAGVGGAPVDGPRVADVDPSVLRAERVDPIRQGPQQVPQQEVAQATSAAPQVVQAVQSTELSGSAAPAGAFADPALDGLHTALQQKVMRVMERMTAEHGHTVEVVEGYRTPERQRQLYAQGRSAPGPIVTWTTESRHSEGLAVDLRVDGTWKAPEAYAHLQRIAREEGLGTLGMRDPGHLELRMDGDGPSRLARQDRPSSDAGERPAPQARSRRPGLARVARVASVADVARPARVATPGTPVRVRGQAAAFEIPAEPVPVPEPNPVDVMVPKAAGDTRVASMSPASGASAPALQGGTPEVGLVSELRADPMAGVQRVLDAKEALEAMSSSRISVRLDGMAGPVDRIRVSLADRALDAWINVRESGSTDDMRAGLADLYRALEGRGFDPGTLAVNSVAGREAALESALSTRGDVAAGVLRTFIDAMTAPRATRSGPEQGHQQRQQQQTSDEGRSGQEGFARSRRENSRENRRNER